MKILLCTVGNGLGFAANVAAALLAATALAVVGGATAQARPLQPAVPTVSKATHFPVIDATGTELRLDSCEPTAPAAWQELPKSIQISRVLGPPAAPGPCPSVESQRYTRPRNSREASGYTDRATAADASAMRLLAPSAIRP